MSKTTPPANENPGADKGPWLPRMWKRRATRRSTQEEQADKERLEKYADRLEQMTAKEFSATAHYLLLDTTIDRALSRNKAGAHAVEASVVADLMLDLRKYVEGTDGQEIVERILNEANENLWLRMPLGELKRSLERIKLLSLTARA